jgi:hypothetical protein
MNPSDLTVMVGLYLLGADLSPHRITDSLRIQPTVSQARGDIRTTPSGTDYVIKTGTWGLVIDRTPGEVSDLLDELFAKLGPQPALASIPGVQEAYFDIFIASLTDEDGDSTCAMAFSTEQTEKLSRYNLPVRITMTSSRP